MHFLVVRQRSDDDGGKIEVGQLRLLLTRIMPRLSLLALVTYSTSTVPRRTIASGGGMRVADLVQLVEPPGWPS